MKTKGIKDKEVQVTFEGNHPTSGCVMGFTWKELKFMFEKNFSGSGYVLSIKVTERGVDVYGTKIQEVRSHMEERGRFLN